VDGRRRNSCFPGNPAQRYTNIYRFYAPGTPLRAASTGSTTPYIFTFYLRKTKRTLPDYLADTEGPNPIPRTNSITQSTLITELKGFPASLFYYLYPFFEGS
jgi:hypothetical protein